MRSLVLQGVEVEHKLDARTSELRERFLPGFLDLFAGGCSIRASQVLESGRLTESHSFLCLL